jgi:hypothetical protein
MPDFRQVTRSLSIHPRKVAQFLGVGLAVLLLCLPAFSQGSQGTIQGAVLDQSGGAIAGTTVSVIDVARGVTRALVTDGAGEYVATSLNPGTYTVRAEAKGFRTEEHSGVLLEVGQNVRVDMVLQPGEQTQTITVTGEVPAIDTTDATLGGTVSNEAINALPLNGRNFDRLLQLRPGVVTPVGGGSAGGQSHTNGRRDSGNVLRVEGIAGMAQAQGSDILNATYRVGDADSLMPIDAIQEFSTTTNSQAEYGFRDGAVVNVGVKSGTNSLHGTAYAFGRDASATDAANSFTRAVTPATLEQFGATAGGPILKDKLFWFVGFEGLRLTVGDASINTIPADVAMGGNTAFSMVDACNALGPGKISPLSAQLAGLNPTTCVVSPASSTVENLFPFTTNTATSGNYLPPLTTFGPLNNGLIKGDYILGPHHHLSGMYFVSKSSGQANSVSGQLLPQWETVVTNNVQQYDGSWTWTPNSTWVNDFRVGYVYMNDATALADQKTLVSNPWPSGYGINTGVTNPVYGGLPQIQIQTFTGFLGGGNRSSIRGPEGDMDLVESVSYLHGRHAFKFGFEYVDVVLDGDTYSQAQGNIVFANLTSFLQGVPSTGTILLGDPTNEARSHWYGAFFQDDWRVTNRITLNLGVRYDYFGSPTVRNNYLGNFNPNVNPLTTPAVQQVGPGAPLPTLYNAERRDFSPRLGVAWDVQGNGKTVVRAGAGVFRNASLLKTFIGVVPFGANFPSIGVNNSGTDINAHTPAQPNLVGCGASACGVGQLNWTTAGPIFPTTAPQTINGVNYTGASCTPASPCTLPAVDPNFLDAYSAQWNLDIQRAITNKLTVDVAYVGNRGFNEQAEIDLNQPPIGAGWVGTPTSNCLASAPLYTNCKVSAAQEAAGGKYRTVFPYFNYIAEATSGDFSNYNALQVTAQARGYHRLSFLAGYTYAHSLSEADNNSTGGVSAVTDNSNLRLNYGSSTVDIRHRFTISPSYAIPGMKSPGQMLQGWSISGILILQTGFPWQPSQGSSVDYLGTGEIGIGVTQPWNYSGPASAFTAGTQPIPCFGKFSGCTAFPVVGGVPQLPAACVSAEQAQYAGNATLQGLALAALTNSGCYVQGGGVLTPPAFGTIGNASKGIFAGPSYKNVDFSVSKDWKFKERFGAQFRVEFFNFFNRTDVGAPGTNPAGSNFGYAITTPDTLNPVVGSGGPRHIQFGLKLRY